MEANLKALNAEIERQGRRKDWIAKKLGVKPPQVTYMLAGTRPFKDEQLKKLAKMLEVSLEKITQ